jgi:hypothetical protein
LLQYRGWSQRAPDSAVECHLQAPHLSGWPDVFGGQDTSVSRAKRAISDYKKAVGDPEGLAELMVFYCEEAAGFCSDIVSEDERYFDALVRMFEQVLKLTNGLSAERRDELTARLDRVRGSSAIKWAMGSEMTWIPSFRSTHRRACKPNLRDFAAGGVGGRTGRFRGHSGLCGQSEHRLGSAGFTTLHSCPR